MENIKIMIIASMGLRTKCSGFQRYMCTCGCYQREIQQCSWNHLRGESTFIRAVVISLVRADNILLVIQRISAENHSD